MSETKLDRLRALLQSYESCLVAYSGGVDSVFLAKVGLDVLGSRLLAVLADSPSLPRRELEEAKAIATAFGIPLEIVRTDEFEDLNYVSNPVNRCYFCKRELFTHLVPLARARGFEVIAYGENASDAGDYRPGSQAAAEFQIRAPLREVGLTKREIRELSAQLGLPTAEKAQMACLSSRIPYGEVVSPEKLAMIEAAENVLKDLGFHEVRVRHHELGNREQGAADLKPVQALARIEVGVEELAKLARAECYEVVARAIERLGYRYVTLDLRGYRRGALNEDLKSKTLASASRNE